jgi:hypothetical protein
VSTKHEKLHSILQDPPNQIINKVNLKGSNYKKEFDEPKKRKKNYPEHAIQSLILVKEGTKNFFKL